jgi:hypothetical protein
MKANPNIRINKTKGEKAMAQQGFKEILKEMEEIFEAKNKEYAFGDDWSSNLTLVEKMGLDPWRGTVVRVSDKVSRLLNLAKPENPAPKEAIHDAFLDNAIYSVMGIMLLEGCHPEPDQREKVWPKTRRRRTGKPATKTLETQNPPAEGVQAET